MQKYIFFLNSQVNRKKNIFLFFLLILSKNFLVLRRAKIKPLSIPCKSFLKFFFSIYYRTSAVLRVQKYYLFPLSQIFLNPFLKVFFNYLKTRLLFKNFFLIFFLKSEITSENRTSSQINLPNSPDCSGNKNSFFFKNYFYCNKSGKTEYRNAQNNRS